ncbi:hypothetical protein GZZ45_24010, partial [Klebsiella aerogenes]|uniref:hypothetical protein n=1 Tax=Klebsiella aerogenes TaxID=548 RepID=UPI0019068C52
FFEAEWLATALVLLCAAGLLLVLATVTVRSHTPARDDAACGLHLTAMLLLSPLTWDHSLVLLAGPLLVAGRDLFASPRWRL